MNEAVYVALVMSVIAPTVGLLVTKWMDRRTKKQDWARQDQLAAAVAAAATLAAAQAAEAARLLLVENEKKAKASALINGKLDVVHALVNSALTAAMQAELDAMVRELASLQELAELKESAGKRPTKLASETMKSTETKIEELQLKIEERHKQNGLVAPAVAALAALQAKPT